MKQRILLIGLAIIMAVITIGCGGGDDNLGGSWERPHHANRGATETLEFSGSNFTFNTYVMPPTFRWEARTFTGTFSISGDYIEFVFEDGSIDVQPFSRTENTLNFQECGRIASGRFTRASGGSGATTSPAAAAPAAAAPAVPATPAPAAPAAPAPTVSGGDGLDGRWELEHEGRLLPFFWIEFSGNNFIAPLDGFFGSHALWFGTFTILDEEIEFVNLVIGFDRVRTFPFSHAGNTVVINDMIFIRSGDVQYADNDLNGGWDGPHGRIYLWGNNYAFTCPQARRSFGIPNLGDGSGTFSIQGDQIEFIGDYGGIVAFPFTRTENTITIGQHQFTRAR